MGMKSQGVAGAHLAVRVLRVMRESCESARRRRFYSTVSCSVCSGMVVPA